MLRTSNQFLSGFVFRFDVAEAFPSDLEIRPQGGRFWKEGKILELFFPCHSQKFRLSDSIGLGSLFFQAVWCLVLSTLHISACFSATVYVFGSFSWPHTLQGLAIWLAPCVLAFPQHWVPVSLGYSPLLKPFRVPVSLFLQSIFDVATHVCNFSCHTEGSNCPFLSCGDSDVILMWFWVFPPF